MFSPNSNSIHTPRFTSNPTSLLGFYITYTPFSLDLSIMYYLHEAFAMLYTGKSFMGVFLTTTIKDSSEGQHLFNFPLIPSGTVHI